MRKMKMLIVLAFILINVRSFEQEKLTIAILPTKNNTHSLDEKYLSAINDAIVNGFIEAKRFTVIDRTRTEEIKSEKELQKTEDYINSNTLVEQGKNLGAQYLLSTALTNYTNDGATCLFTITISIIDVSTQQVTISGQISPNGASLKGSLGGLFKSMNDLNATLNNNTNANTNNALKDYQGSLNRALNDFSPKIKKFINENFPTYFEILSIEEKDKHGNPSIILLNAGSSTNIRKGDKLKIFEIVEIEVNGTKMKRKKIIGELKVNEVEDANFSKCAVKGGGEIINSKFESKLKIYAMP